MPEFPKAKGLVDALKAHEMSERQPGSMNAKVGAEQHDYGCEGQW